MTNVQKKKHWNNASVEVDKGSGDTLTAISPVAMPDNTAGIESNGPASVDNSQEGPTTGDSS
jgi:hypothetical protein